MPACSMCGQPAVLLQRYSGAHLCGEHAQRSVEKRVTKEMARDKLRRGDVVVVAVSGGKDSVCALRFARRYLAPAGVEVRAVTVDEGIASYRPAGIEVAASHCKELDVPHEVVRDRDAFGVTMDEASQRLEGAAPCSPCGVFRRTLLNKAAREHGAARLVTGHNLDDLAQSVLMNVLRGDAARLARLGRHEARDGLVPRSTPLRMVPEREVALYAHLQGWAVHNEECPYAVLAQRRGVRDTLLELEEREPGTRHALVAFLDKVQPALAREPSLGAELRACLTCGEPTSGERCQACAMAERVRA
ncbi:MAG: TIGR00269 family protein [Halobacteriales archaeon]|nr:TIGR00269 family protein [Halobacteriales archaeon]